MGSEMPIGDTQVRPSVCRRLFSEPEENQVGYMDNFRNQFLDNLRKEQEAAKLKWNFDFTTETPLEGRWQWEKVGEESTVTETPLDIVTGENEVVLNNNQANVPEPPEQKVQTHLDTEKSPLH